MPGPMILAPLDESPATWTHYCSRVIFERGIELRRVLGDTPAYLARDAPDRWAYYSQAGEAETDYKTFLDDFSYATVALVVEGQDGVERQFTSSDTGAPVLELQVQKLEQAARSLRAKLRRSYISLVYMGESTVYHCRRLTDLYRGVLASGDIPVGPDDMLRSRVIDQYFEFEALICDSIRAFETARLPLWAAFGSGSMPRNYAKLIKSIGSPPALSAFLGSYEDAKDYSDCTHHFAHFGSRLPFARLQLHKGKVWSVTAMIPDNPSVRSHDHFSFDQRLDALSYGWTMTNQVIKLVHSVSENLAT